MVPLNVIHSFSSLHDIVTPTAVPRQLSAPGSNRLNLNHWDRSSVVRGVRGLSVSRDSSGLKRPIRARVESLVEFMVEVVVEQ